LILVDTSPVPPDAQEQKSVPQVLGELKEMTVSYAKQETIDPIKGLGRFVGFGVGGSMLLGIGLCLLCLAALRALQTETDGTFDGFWSWAPYFITTVVIAIFAFLAVRAIKEKPDGDR
jgi:hypothetical protein